MLDLDQICTCTRCERLVEHRRKVAQTKRRAYREQVYWGKPVPAFGRRTARLLIVGLAPGAHGANRTGRMFTGDSSGDFLYATLHRYGFCNQSTSRDRGDGLRLLGTYITAALHCVPPGNKPTAEELSRCRVYLCQELQMLEWVGVVIALGAIAWQSYFKARSELGWPSPRPRPRFAHGGTVEFQEGTVLLGSYHPSRQNTQTGRLTREMFDSIFAHARDLLDSP